MIEIESSLISTRDAKGSKPSRFPEPIAEGHVSLARSSDMKSWLLAFVFAFALCPTASLHAGQIGIASRFCELSRTASGRSYSCKALVAAHRTLPFGKRVTVRNLANGKQVTVTIVDRGPFVKGRIIDLSEGAARLLGSADLMRVEISVE
jgi:rare lipoprotein A